MNDRDVIEVAQDARAAEICREWAADYRQNGLDEEAGYWEASALIFGDIGGPPIKATNYGTMRRMLENVRPTAASLSEPSPLSVKYLDARLRPYVIEGPPRPGSSLN